MGDTAVQSARLTIAEAFERTRRAKRTGLVPFLPAGYPDLQATKAILPALDQAGATVIEVGFPYSDPVADGPTIQEAFNAALMRKLKVADIFESVADVQASIATPMVAMVSFSVVFRYGVERFVRDAKSAGFSGLILPDLPPPEAQKICDTVRAGGLDTILLVAPTTTPRRREEIACLSSGFVYYLSVSGITGERKDLPADLPANLRQLRSITDKPLCVGFGISTRQHVQQLDGLADGAIVGSAVVRQIRQHAGAGAEQIAAAVAAYARSLLGNER